MGSLTGELIRQVGTQSPEPGRPPLTSETLKRGRMKDDGWGRGDAKVLGRGGRGVSVGGEGSGELVFGDFNGVLSRLG